LQGLFSLWYIY